MDYTTLAAAKAALHAEKDTHDEILGGFITAASREIDRRVTGRTRLEAQNYFELEDVVDQVVRGVVDADGTLLCWPRKSQVNSVSAFAYRSSPLDSWTDVDPQYLTFDGILVCAWINAASLRGRKGLQVKISYSGGFAAEPEDLPADLIEAAVVLTARFYREGETGLSDAIGVAELGTLTYTKALPIRVKEVIQQYKRTAPW